MRRWAERLGALGLVVPFDYPYMRERRKLPDRLPALIAAHAEALAAAEAAHPGRPVVLAGKSMGSRVGCHLSVQRAREGRPVAALVCFGYPLRAAGSGALRDQVLRELTTPILFLQGSRDELCPPGDLAAVRPAMAAPHELHLVEGGDHSLEVRKRDPGPAQAEHDEALLQAIARFLARHTAGAA
jgi:predicted alpha/beta-hydrolase family hydrolase